MISEQILSSILQAANQKIVSKAFCERHRIGKAFSRSGRLSFSNLMYFILQSTHKSISINYSQLIDCFPLEKLPFVSKQAISKARQGISSEVFVELFRLSVKAFYEHSQKLTTWNGFHVYAVDGSTIQIPESKENLQVFGANPNKTGKNSPLASISALYDVINDILVDVSLHSYRYDERKSGKKHMNFLPDSSNTIILFDRGYPSEDLFRFLHSKDILFLMRIPKTFKKAVFEQQDTLFTYPSISGESSLTLRSFHFPLEDGNMEHLVTNVMTEQLKTEAFKKLYRLRWGIESKYRELKNRLEIESFNCIKPISIHQEFFVAMFLPNLVAIIKREADSMINAYSENKHHYQTNRSYILNRIKSNIIFLLKASRANCKKMFFKMVEDASKVLSIIRPNRKFGRYRKHTRRKYYNHMKSCV